LILFSNPQIVVSAARSATLCRAVRKV
jgi:hypothetical protein